jgi:hypothetical protein
MMIGDWHRSRSGGGLPLHHDVTATLSNLLETMVFEDPADLAAGERP